MKVMTIEEMLKKYQALKNKTTSNTKNQYCHSSSDCYGCRDCWYSQRLSYCVHAWHSHLCYECSDIFHCYGCFESHHCYHSSFCKNLTHGLFCHSLHFEDEDDGSYYILNESVSKIFFEAQLERALA